MPGLPMNMMKDYFKEFNLDDELVVDEERATYTKYAFNQQSNKMRVRLIFGWIIVGVYSGVRYYVGE